MSDQPNQKTAQRVSNVLNRLNAPEKGSALEALSNMAGRVDFRDYEVVLRGTVAGEHAGMTRQAVRAFEREIAKLKRQLEVTENLHTRAHEEAAAERIQRQRIEATLKATHQKQEQKQPLDLKYLRSKKFSPSRGEDDLKRDLQVIAQRRGVDEHNTCVIRDVPLGGLVHALLIAAGYSTDDLTTRRRKASGRPTQKAFLEGIIQHPTYRWLMACRKAYLIVLSDDWPAIDDGSFSLCVEKINKAAEIYRNGLKAPKKRVTRDRQRLDKIREAVREREWGTAIRLDSIWAKEDAKAEPVQ